MKVTITRDCKKVGLTIDLDMITEIAGESSYDGCLTGDDHNTLATFQNSWTRKDHKSADVVIGVVGEKSARHAAKALRRIADELDPPERATAPIDPLPGQ